MTIVEIAIGTDLMTYLAIAENATTLTTTIMTAFEFGTMLTIQWYIKVCRFNGMSETHTSRTAWDSHGHLHLTVVCCVVVVKITVTLINIVVGWDVIGDDGWVAHSHYYVLVDSCFGGMNLVRQKEREFILCW